MATEAEEHALTVFLQGLAIAVVKTLHQASPQDRKMHHFRQALDVHLQVLLDDPSTYTALCSPGGAELQRLLHLEIERVQKL